jgi:hypothetical protein
MALLREYGLVACVPLDRVPPPAKRSRNGRIPTLQPFPYEEWPMTPSQTFVVRVWHTGGEPAGFRATVRAVENEQATLFTSAEALGRYLAGATSGTPHQAACHSSQGGHDAAPR